MRHDDGCGPSGFGVIHREKKKLKAEGKSSFPPIVEVICGLNRDTQCDGQRRGPCQFPDLCHQIRANDHFLEERVQQEKRNGEEARMSEDSLSRVATMGVSKNRTVNAMHDDIARKVCAIGPDCDPCSSY